MTKYAKNLGGMPSWALPRLCLWFLNCLFFMKILHTQLFFT